MESSANQENVSNRSKKGVDFDFIYSKLSAITPTERTNEQRVLFATILFIMSHGLDTDLEESIAELLREYPDILDDPSNKML